MKSLPLETLENQRPPREQFGFRRTVCGCEFCRAPCRHLPGSLDVSDLRQLCPPDQDLLAWAEQHLRAVTDKPFPTLVPARQANGHCHWLVHGRCQVHANAPYGCAFFDTHQTPEEAERRADATIQARREDEAHDGLYFQVWRHLCRKGLTARSGDRDGLAQDFDRLRRHRQRSLRRARSDG